MGTKYACEVYISKYLHVSNMKCFHWSLYCLIRQIRSLITNLSRCISTYICWNKVLLQNFSSSKITVFQINRLYIAAITTSVSYSIDHRRIFISTNLILAVHGDPLKYCSRTNIDSIWNDKLSLDIKKYLKLVVDRWPYFPARTIYEYMQIDKKYPGWQLL